MRVFACGGGKFSLVLRESSRRRALSFSAGADGEAVDAAAAGGR